MLAYHVAFLVLFVGTTAFFTALSVLNLRHGARTLERERDWVADRLGLEDPDRVVAYQRAKTTLSAVRTWAFVALVLAVLYSGTLVGSVLEVNPTPSSKLETATAGHDEWENTTPTDAGESLFGPMDR